jgi:hypothetical protein
MSVEEKNARDVSSGDFVGCSYSFKGAKEIYDGFADGEMGCSDHLDIFSLCLMADDKTYRSGSESYRISLPTNFSVSSFLH